METLTLAEMCNLIKMAVGTARNRLSENKPMPRSYRLPNSRKYIFYKDEVENWLKSLPTNGEKKTEATPATFKTKSRGRPKKSLQRSRML